MAAFANQLPLVVIMEILGAHPATPARARGVEDDRLDDDELVSAALTLLLAGYSTTVDLIGNGVLAIATAPGLASRARADVPAFVEEVLRHSTSRCPCPGSHFRT